LFAERPVPWRCRGTHKQPFQKLRKYSLIWHLEGQVKCPTIMDAVGGWGWGVGHEASRVSRGPDMRMGARVAK